MQVTWLLGRRFEISFIIIYFAYSWKKTLLFLAITISISSFAQTRKAFLSDDGSVVDSSKAKFYIIIDQVSDTAWVAKQYNLGGDILNEGIYKDKNLQTPHGKFIYYRKVLKTEQEPNPVNYVETIGEFKDGLRDGTWLTFGPDSSLISIDNYINDKLNGLHETYGGKTLPITIRGNYVNDLREGNWYTISKSGNIIRTEGFEHGKKISDKKKPSTLKAPILPNDFINYLNKKISRVVSNDTNETVFLHCIITDEGKLINPKVTNLKLNRQLSDLLSKALLESPKWRPAYDINLKKNVELDTGFFITIKNGNVTTQYSSQAAELLYQINN